MRISLDFIGITASLLCAVHCLLIPVFFTVSAFAQLGWLADPLVEFAFIGIGLLVAAWSLTTGYLAQHGRLFPVLIGLSGFLFLLFGRFLPGAWEHVTTPLGGILIATAHWINWRLNRREPANTCRFLSTREKKQRLAVLLFALLIIAVWTFLATPHSPLLTHRELLETIWKPVR